MATSIVLFLCVVGGSTLYVYQLVWVMRWITRDTLSRCGHDGDEDAGMYLSISTLHVASHAATPEEPAVVDLIVAVEDGAASSGVKGVSPAAAVPWRLPGGYSWPDRAWQ